MEHVAVGSKRSHDAESVISTADKGPDEKKPKLKVVTSAIRNALSKSFDGESSKIGLLAYFSKGTAEDRANFFAREDKRLSKHDLNQLWTLRMQTPERSCVKGTGQNYVSRSIGKLNEKTTYKMGHAV